MLPSHKQKRQTRVSMDIEYDKVVKHVGSLGALSADLLAKFQKQEQSRCPLCNARDGTVQHIIWTCTHPNMVTERGRMANLGTTYQQLLQHWDWLPKAL